MAEVHGAFRRVGKATYSRATDAAQDAAFLKRIVDVLDRASKEIEAIPR